MSTWRQSSSRILVSNGRCVSAGPFPVHTAHLRRGPDGMGLHRLLRQWRERLLAGDGSGAFERARDKQRAGDTTGAVSALREAAQFDHAEACYLLGSMHLSGEAVGTDVPLAMDLFQRAARQGSAAAMVLLAARYADGNGVARDLGKSRSLLGRAAELGEPVAMGCLGLSYLEGIGGAADIDLAVYWLRKAVARRHGPACNALAVLHERGQGVEADPSEAFLWFRRAAEVGDINGQYNLGRAYQTGLGVRPDAEAAARWFLKAAEQGDADAQLAIARCLINGRGVEVDPVAAARWLHLAVDQQHPTSMVFLAGLYADGLGVGKDPPQAYALITRARDLGVDTSEVEGMVLGSWAESFVERHAKVDSTGTDAERSGQTDEPVHPEEKSGARGDPPPEVPGADEHSPSEMDRRSCFLAYHLLPEWLFAAPPGRTFDAAAIKPVVDTLWGEAWRLALPFAKHNWTAASTPDALDIDVGGERWLCVWMDTDTLAPAPCFMLVRWPHGEPEIWLAEVAASGHCLLCQIDKDSRHTVLGGVKSGDPFKVAAALTCGGQRAAMLDNDDSGGVTLMHVFSYAEVSSDLESARRSGRETPPSGRPHA